MYNIITKNVSSLEKVLPEMHFCSPELNDASCLKNERFSYQIAFIGNKKTYCGKRFEIKVTSPLKEKIKIYEVQNVPVMLSTFPDHQDNSFIKRAPSLLPDLLSEYTGDITVSNEYYKALWVAVEVDEDTKAESYEIKIEFIDEETGCADGESIFTLKVKNSVLPKQKLIFTQWFHCDCISSFYGLEPLCETHWQYIENFAKTAAKNGINMLLTPIFTPALDTKIGAERPTVQLLDIEYKNGKYLFGFDKLLRWLEMCKRVGIEYLEIAHLFSQWGAEKTPKIVVFENGEKIKKFGWYTDSLGDEYKEFLSQMLPALTEFLKKNWESKKIYFHISDEPSEKHIERYGKLYGFVKPFLKDFNIMDALSEYEIYEKGYTDVPVSTIRTIHNFINHKVENLWGYYCCGECDDGLSNRFIAMPSYRNRIIGAQLYKYGIKGFLHWGYNFYYSQHSTKLINPFVTTDANGAFPSGDSFSVYPGFGGVAVPSLRLFVFFEALQDMRAMSLAEEKFGKEKVVELIDECTEITFNDYPQNPEYILNLREKINSLFE